MDSGLIVSIHAPRVGSDAIAVEELTENSKVSIHAPRVGSDRFRDFAHVDSHVFQSTLPAWGATISETYTRSVRSVSIHAPRVGSDSIYSNASISASVSIHAPRVGSD